MSTVAGGFWLPPLGILRRDGAPRQSAPRPRPRPSPRRVNPDTTLIARARTFADGPAANLRRFLADPVQVGARTLPPVGLVVLAALGATLLLVVALARWQTPSDEHAYWLAGQRLIAHQPLYDPTAGANTPYAYWYPPVFAQLVAPISVILPALWFTAAWTILLLGCIWFLAGGRVLVALALVAFVPVAVELWFRNVHLLLAVIVVLAIRRWPVLFSVGAAIKLAPGLGIAYLAARGRWRDAAVTTGAGLLILVVSALLSPNSWREFVDVVLARGPGDAASLVPVPYVIRAVAALALAVLAARLPVRAGEPLLVVAITLANPTLWMTGFSLLAALVPIVWPRARTNAP